MKMERCFKLSRVFILLVLAFSFSHSVFAQSVTVASANPAVPAATIGQGAEVPIYAFNLTGTNVNNNNAPVQLTDVAFTTTGTYTVGATPDITTFKLWYSTYNVFDDNAIQIGSNLAAAAAGTQTFAAFTGLIVPYGVTYYFWITADVATTATAGRTIAVSALTNAQLTLSGGPAVTNTAAAGGTQTLGTTITTGAVNNPICIDSTITIPFAANGTFTAGNVFTAQLSNAAGSFAAPVTIGTFTSTTSGTITGTISAATPTGTGYLIRVVSSTPVVTGSANSNGSITINTPMTYATSTVTAVAGNASINCSLPNAILQLAITVSGDCAPQTLTQINFNTTGSTSPGNDISKAQIYYTGQTPGFTSSEQFGSDVFAPIGTFSVTGTQELSLGAGTYYFYLAYEMASTAIAGDVVGAAVTSFTLGGVTISNMNPNAAGTQTVVTGSSCTYSITKIPDLYFCSGVYTNAAAQTVNFNLNESSANNEFNGNQTTKTLILSLPPNFAFSNGAQTVTFTGGGNVTAANLTAVVTGATSITVTITTNNAAAALDNIDFNNFQIYPTAPGSGDLVRTAGTFSVQGSIGNPTSSQSFGHMLAGPALEYSSSAVKQYDTTASIVDTCNNTPYGILEVQVNVTDPCGPATVTQFNFSTAGNPGSTAPATDITKAEVYYTGQTPGLNFGSWFGSVTAPSGAFTINGSEELDLGAGTYYFYLVYDIPKTAVAGDVLDASLTSFVIDGTTITNMSTPNPSGSRMIATGTCSPTLNSETPTPNLQTINAGSLVIPMDNAHQNLFGGLVFNLKAYGLVHELLMNNIPVMWVIKSGKTQDAPDFIASAGRAYPTVTAAATQTFVASEFIVDVNYKNNPGAPGGLTATQVITAFEAVAPAPMVAVYTLTASVPNVDVRYILNAQPKIAIFSNGGNQAIQKAMLDTARVRNYVVENAGNFGGLSSCYTFCSEAHWEYEPGNAVLGNLAPVSNVMQFVAEGGNFLAQCAGIDLYENHQPTGGHFLTSEGISYSGTEPTSVSYAPDMAYSQFQTNGGTTVTPNGGSLIGMYWPKPSSVYKPQMYSALGTTVAPTSTNTVIATGIHLASPDSVGSNVFYLSGHQYNTTAIGDLNGSRLYLNATLIPAKRPTAFLANMNAPATVCLGTTYTLGGNPTGPAGATYTWSSNAGGGLNSTIVANPTATPAAVGTYTYNVSINNNGCPGSGQVVMTVVATPTVSAGPNQTICAGVTTVSLSGTTNQSGGTWTSPTGGVFSPGATTLNATYTPTATDITNGVVTLTLTTIDTYTTCVSAKSTMTLTINGAPTASVGATNTTTVCANSTVPLNGSVTNATGGIWTSPTGGTFSPSATTLNGTYTPSATDITNGVVTLTLTTTGNKATCSAAVNTLTVTINAAPTASVGAVKSMTICANAPVVAISGTATNGTGVWSSSGTGTFSPNTSISATNYTLSNADTAARKVKLYLTVTGLGACNTSAAKDSLTIIVTPQPIATVDAVKSVTVCANAPVIVISGKATNGTGVWSSTGTGAFNPNTSINATSYTLSNADTAAHSVKLMLTVTGTGSCGTSAAKDSLTITVTPVPVASVGAVKSLTVCANAPVIAISGTATNGTGVWSSTGSGAFSPNTSINATSYTLSNADTAAHKVKLYLSVTGNGACSSSTAKDSLTITITPEPLSTVGAVKSVTVCANAPVVAISGTATNGTGVWSSTGTGAFSPNTSINATSYTLSNADTTAHNVKLYLSVTGSGACGSSTAKDSLTITITPEPLATVGAVKSVTVCANAPLVAISGTATNGIGVWSSTGTGVFSPNTSINATSYTLSNADTAAHSVKLYLSVTGSGACGSSTAKDSLTITITPQPLATVGAVKSMTVCANAPLVTISGTATNGTGVWSSTGTGAFGPNTSINATSYTLSNADTAAHTVKLYLSVTGNGVCGSSTAKDSLTITITPEPLATVGAVKSVTVCANAPLVTISGTATNGTGVWSSTGTGAFNPNTSINATSYTLSNADTAAHSVKLYLSVTGSGACGTSTAKDSLTITTTPEPLATVGAVKSMTVCANAPLVTISGTATNGTGVWSSNGTGTFSPNTSINAISYTLSNADTAAHTVKLYLSVTGNGSCGSSVAQDSLTIMVTPVPVATVGAVKSMTVCANAPLVTISGTATNGTGVWSSNGTGTFSPNTGINATGYTLSNADTAAHAVKLYLSVTGNGVCGSSVAQDSLTITITSVPVASVGAVKSVTVCANAPVVSISGTATNGTGVWSSNGSGAFSPNTGINATSYTLSNADTAAHAVKLYLSVTGNGVCGSSVAQDSLTINITTVPIATVVGPPSTTVCANVFVVPISGTVINGTGIWSTSGSGTFSPNTSTNATSYTLSNADTTAKLVHLTLSAVGFGGCSTYTATSVFTIATSPTPIVSVGASKSVVVCSNTDSISLTATEGGATGIIWTTTNGTGSFVDPTALNTSYIYSNADTAKPYVMLKITTTGNGACNPVQDSLKVNFNKAPHAKFTIGTNPPVCLNEATLFASTSTAITGFTSHWKFGDNTSSVGNNVSHTYAAQGIYSVSLTVVDGNGCRDSATQFATVHSLPVAIFSSTAHCFRDSVYFKDLSTIINVSNDKITAWHWNFGDGDSSLIQNPAHLYPGPNTYLGILTVTSNYGCIGDSAQTLNVSPSPIANFATDSVCFNNATQFVDKSPNNLNPPSAGHIVSWKLYYGDNTADSTTLNATTVLTSHTYSVYPVSGSYTATLIVAANNGCSDTLSEPVVIHPLPQPDFSYSTVCLADSTHFMDKSTISSGSVVGWKWDFGDGGVFATTQNPLHKYPAVGSYGVSLKAISNYSCTATTSKVLTIDPSPKAAFSQNRNTVPLNSEVQFTNNSVGSNINTFNWYFGDTTGIDTSTMKNPSYTYKIKGGVFTVKLVVKNSSLCTDSTTGQIIVEMPPKVPNAFTPNGDGNNDVLYVLGGPYVKLEFRVVDNWGDFIFYSDNQSQGWDGTKNGVKQPPGVYVYTIVATTPDNMKHTTYGDVTLIR